MTFKTQSPATYTDPDTGQEFSLTFDAQGTTTPSGPQAAKITDGTIQEQVSGSNGNGPQTFTGNITSGFYITSRNPPGIQFYATIQNADYYVEAFCSISADNSIEVGPYGSNGGTFLDGEFNGPAECSPSQGGEDTTTQSEAVGRSQDGDGDRDGLPDSSDRCLHNSNPRGFKEDIWEQ